MKKNILLLHGWDYELYSSKTKHNDAWADYKEFINNLSKNNNIYKINFPGFCQKEEPTQKEWNVEKYANYVQSYIEDNNLNIDIVIGYSFGGAVAVKWKSMYKNTTKLFLIAPAIIRNADKSKKFIKTPKCLNFFRNFIRDLYLIYKVKNPEMKYGTKFLRNSYQVIVREDMRKELDNINYKDIHIIYGTKDTAVDPYKLYDTVNDKLKNNISFVDNANHDDIITKYNKEVCNKLDSIIKD
jgi:pimeloyl-ACP methyl ester carboxylesterase